MDIEKMTEAQAKEMLKNLISVLDDADGDDFFGTEGWRHQFGLENYPRAN